MWVIMQTGYRAKDGSAYGYGKSHVGPTRKLTAVCRSEAGVRKWLRRLERWAAEGVRQSNHAALIPIYEVMTVNSLGGLGPASCVGPAYYADHGRETALRAIVLGVRESHTALRWEARRRQALVHDGASVVRSGGGRPDRKPTRPGRAAAR
jgi:hypothetical protein